MKLLFIYYCHYYYKCKFIFTFIAEGSFKTRKTVALACDVMTRTVTVDALWACLTASVPKVSRGANCKENKMTSAQQLKKCKARLSEFRQELSWLFILTPLACGASEAGGALTGSFIRWARCSILAVTENRAVGPPVTLDTNTVTVDPWQTNQQQTNTEHSGLYECCTC